ncbi:dihydroxyacetone kinase phosphoryl donor subunit DhaM [Ligilactobacillus sp. LYQ135]
MNYGILIVSHVPDIAKGVAQLIEQVAQDTSVTFAGGTDNGVIGTNLQKISDAIDANEAKEILAFYDLGSSKMNIELAAELTNKKIHIYDVALVEGTYIAASLIPTGSSLNEIEKQLKLLEIKK